MHASAGLVDPKAELTIGADVTLIESMPTYPTRDHIRAVRLSHCRQQGGETQMGSLPCFVEAMPTGVRRGGWMDGGGPSSPPTPTPPCERRGKSGGNGPPDLGLDSLLPLIGPDQAIGSGPFRRKHIMRFWYFNSYPGVLAAAAAALKVSPLLPLLTMAPNHALAPAPSVNLGGE
ncbi:hypothetical protein BHE74_00039638 [Ensete ventricosum]|nr:hypothetical protein BHE74_00039638 [Ensete ventricosum]